MGNKRKSVIVALSFIGALLLFVWGFNFLKGKSLLNNYPYYYAVYPYVNELGKSNKVLVNGMPVGQVEELFFNPKNDGSIVVRFSVSKDVRVPSNSVAFITNDFLGSNSIKLVLGDSQSDAQLGDTLASGNETGLMDLMSNNLTPILGKIDLLMTNLDTLINKVNALVDDEMCLNVRNSVSNISTSMENLAYASNDIRQVIGNEKDKISNIVNALDNAALNLADISDSLSKIKYQNLMNSLQTTIDNLNVITTNLKNGEGSAGLLLNNDSLYRNLNNAVESVNSLIENIENNPKKYIKISVF
ncbi:MAG: MlaD family protein [Candidatus Limimorpha sp.]